MSTAALMIQGTNSNAGKSVLVAGLCRVFARRGYTVQPFKPQNMSNNAAAVGADASGAGGGEIGRAQALQARASGVPLSVHQNPVLLKPESDTGAQVVVQGQPLGTLQAAHFGSRRDELLDRVLESFAIVEGMADIVVVEGAGSPAETNLRNGDIANMGFAEAAGVPVILAGDIDRGGVIASLVGTSVVLSESDRALIHGFLINKFRGNVDLFNDGISDVQTRTGWPSMGVVTWCHDLVRLPAEDAVELGDGPAGGALRIAVPMLSRIANFDDVDPLKLEPQVEVQMVPPGSPIPVVDLVIIPGTKATIADLEFFRSQGWDVDLAAHVRRSGRVLGLCGGFQMLGATIADPHGVEGPATTVDGLGLLQVDTVLERQKVTQPVAGTHLGSGETISGYEIHVGRTTGPDTERPVLELDRRREGATSADGRVSGSYVHGIFGSDGFRAAFLREHGATSTVGYDQSVDEALDSWADQLEAELDIDAIHAIAKTRTR